MTYFSCLINKKDNFESLDEINTYDIRYVAAYI